MSSTPKTRKPLITLFTRPRTNLREVMQTGSGNLVFAVVILTGMLLVLLWADLTNLCDHKALGRVISFSLIAGPLLGTVFLLGLTASLSLWVRFLHPAWLPRWELADVLPPIPLRRLILWRIVSREKEAAFWHKPGPSLLRKPWAVLYSAFQWLLRLLGKGEPGFGITLQVLVSALVPAACAMIPIFLNTYFLQGENYYYSDRTYSVLLALPAWIIEFALIGWSCWLIFLSAQMLYDLRGGKSVAAVILALITTLGLTLLTVTSALRVNVWS